jgi:hypothetical protein
VRTGGSAAQVGAVPPISGRAVYNQLMSDIPARAPWSPADNPYAIAVSQSAWWRSAVQLAIGRLDDDPDRRAAPFSSRQIDARNLVLALVQLLSAETLEERALVDLGMDPTVCQVLAQARARFLEALPGIQQMRNALTHFEDWSLGRGHYQQKLSAADGSSPRDLAAYFWGFSYNKDERSIRMGPHTIDVDGAARAADDLHWAIYDAAQEVDRHGRDSPGNGSK